MYVLTVNVVGTLKKVEADFEAYETLMQVNMVNLLFDILNCLLAHLNQRRIVEASLGSVDSSYAQIMIPGGMVGPQWEWIFYIRV